MGMAAKGDVARLEGSAPRTVLEMECPASKSEGSLLGQLEAKRPRIIGEIAVPANAQNRNRQGAEITLHRPFISVVRTKQNIA